MKYLVKILFLLFMMAEIIKNHFAALSSSRGMLPVPVIILLIITASNIYRYKYKNHLLLIIAEFALTTYAAFQEPYFAFVFASIAYDVIRAGHYYLLPVPLACGVYFISSNRLADFLLIAGVCSYLAYGLSKYEMKEISFIETYDRERRYRYELEQAKTKLLASSKDIAHLTEIKERNRIAREMHDTIGHSLAGILIQLQAAYKLFDRDGAKSKEMVKNSIDALSDSVTQLRNTVHNIKPNEKLGVEYLKQIIDNFNFCPVDVGFSGDFNEIPANYMEILGASIKEALTNAARYSKASRMEVKIDTNDMFTRLYIKDNGQGCEKIKEGLGLSGMKERLRNISGSMSVSSDNGFMIVCILPKGDEGGNIFENTDSRR